MQYLISSDSIVLHANGVTNLVNKDSGQIYDLLKHLLLTENYTSALKCTSYNSYYKMAFPDLEKVNGTYYYKGVELQHLNKTVKAFINKGLPLTPLIKFVEKTNELNPLLRDELRKAVSEKSFPITWDGDLIAYKRSSWSLNQVIAPEFSNTDEYRAAYAEFRDRMKAVFVPGQYVCANSIATGLLVSDFNWTANSCPDQGAFYDVKVLVKDVISCSGHNLVVKGYTNLSKLNETYETDSQSTAMLMKVDLGTNIYGQNIVIKKPITVEEARQYLIESFNGASTKSEPDLHKIKVSVSC